MNAILEYFGKILPMTEKSILRSRKVVKPSSIKTAIDVKLQKALVNNTESITIGDIVNFKHNSAIKSKNVPTELTDLSLHNQSQKYLAEVNTQSYRKLSKTKAFRNAMNDPKDFRDRKPLKSLNTDDKKVLYAYSTEYFGGLNPYLRGQDIYRYEKLYKTTPEDLTMMENLLNKALKGKAVNEHQGASMRWQPAGSFEKAYSVKQGENFVEQGFISTSADFKSIDQFRRDLYYSTGKKHPELVMFEGKSGRNISDYSMRSYENEVLFPSKSSFQLTKRERIESIENVPESLKPFMSKYGNLGFEPFDVIHVRELPSG